MGGLLLSLSLILIFFSNEFNEYVINSSRNPSNIPLVLLSIFAIIMAPIYEEIAFRGYFSNKKYLKRLSIVLLVLFILISYKNILAVSFILGLVVSILVNKSTRTTIILAALAFASIHFAKHDEFSFSIVNHFLFYFSTSLILIWITLNFGIKRSIIIHALINFSLFILQIHNLQFPNKDIEIIQNDVFEFQIKRVSFFSDDKPSFTLNKNNISITKMNLRQVYKYLGAKTNQEMLFVKEYEPYMKYNIEVNFINENPEIQDIRKGVVDFLEDKNFIILEKELLP